MSDLSQTISEMPLAGLIPIALLIITGIILWAAGRKVLRACFATVGLIIGGVAGLVISHSLEFGFSPWIPAAILAIIFACIGALMYRVAVAGALALVFATAGPLAVVTVAEIQGVEKSTDVTIDLHSEDAGPDEADDWLNEGRMDLASEALSSELDIGEDAQEHLEKAGDFVSQLIDAAKAWWAETPEEVRPAMIWSAIGGIVVGVLIGTLASSLSTAIVTAFGGALLWLSGLKIVLINMSDTVAEWLQLPATWLLVIWVVIALGGVAIQWTFRAKPADTSS